MGGRAAGEKNNFKKADDFAKACTECQSTNLKVFSSDDNGAFGLNPKMECLDFGSTGMPIEIKVEGKKRVFEWLRT